MKPMQSRLFFGFVLFLALEQTGCVTIREYAYVGREKYPPKPADAFIETYYLANFTIGEPHPELQKKYDVIARFTVAKSAISGSNYEDKAHEKAREIGGDAVVLQLPAPSAAWGTGNSAIVFVLKYK